MAKPALFVATSLLDQRLAGLDGFVVKPAGEVTGGFIGLSKRRKRRLSIQWSVRTAMTYLKRMEIKRGSIAATSIIFWIALEKQKSELTISPHRVMYVIQK